MEEIVIHECHFAPIFFFMFILIPILIELSDLIYESALEKKWKRKSKIGKMSAEEYRILEDLIIAKNSELKDADFEEIGKHLYLFVSAQHIKEESRKQRRKMFLNKINIFKRKGE